jgi:D-tyrosyl-tRNA(Tyr) deacylase
VPAVRAVVQRVARASVAVEGRTVAEIATGLLVLVAAHKNDTEHNAKRLADRVAGMRVFNDQDGKMNLSMSQLAVDPATTGRQQGDHPATPPSFLVVSNFTLYADTSQRRPGFGASAPYDQGRDLYEAFLQALRTTGLPVQTGVYGADMKLHLTNDGPVTLIVDA